MLFKAFEDADRAFSELVFFWRTIWLFLRGRSLCDYQPPYNVRFEC